MANQVRSRWKGQHSQHQAHAQDDPFLDESDDEQHFANSSDSGRFETPQLPEELEHDSDSALEDEDTVTEINESQDGPDILSGGILATLPPRWRNWFLRGISGSLLISGFSFLIYCGPVGLFFLTYLVLFSVYSEVMGLAQRVCKVPQLKAYGWYNFYVLQYFMNMSALWRYLETSHSTWTSFMIRHHELVSFALYMGGLIYFVLTLKQHYMRSYSFLGWSHLTLLFFALPGQILNHLTLRGMIWYILPMTLITLNDIMAFYVGFFFGKTPLIKLSPKKTWEGFVFGGLLTVVLGTALVYLMITPYLICPVQVNPWEGLLESPHHIFAVQTDCTPHPVFIIDTFHIGEISINMYPFLIHGAILGLLFSLVGPFGGFMASGFKRGCKRKNFGGFIPGHGGVTDRCDCMFLCAVIMYVYYKSFIQA
ncbi:phosphatidate cytidylyltransferase, photoreceptor-specific-like [Tigriopus californicus]|uniref:phosphatidate cytidylyltransferase, photoreceptor-specific-like n=1 Tax=Tigriopus californicus TaxID=6832 RepID=UPI0027DA00D4|nr:phosphatidate cytidylyltransferase, photoreceptor-specific-like [Tigriopus californicus]|eukprot:TCALIF_12471-PA protein Name:"Similar to CdsA Phosphatidate cytidylyltransferase, photoreceptor-specific (Drosophila melanogaster)" AED:0.03 eAED:0.03 QI:139/1/1/1/1/1/7/63/423